MNKEEIKEIEENSPPPIFNPDPPKESKKSRTINRVIFLALVAIAVALAIMFYWATATDKPITLNQEPFPTRTIRDHPTAGGVVFLTTDYCKSTTAVGELRVSFESKTREVFLPLAKEASKKGCHVEELAVLIPKDIEPDTYKVKLRLTYDLNPLKQGITQIFYSYPVIIDPTTSTNQLPMSSDLDPKSESTSRSEV